VNTQVDGYLGLPSITYDSDPLVFLEPAPEAVPPTCTTGNAVPAHVERLLTIAGKIFKPGCCRLSGIWVARVPSLQFPPAMKLNDNKHYLINCDHVMCLLHVHAKHVCFCKYVNGTCLRNEDIHVYCYLKCFYFCNRNRSCNQKLVIKIVIIIDLSRDRQS
jgi:hypothetical protein